MPQVANATLNGTGGAGAPAGLGSVLDRLQTALPTDLNESLACLSVHPAPQPLGGLRCTLQVLPYAAVHRWRFSHEWLAVGVLLLMVWFCICCCCCAFCASVTEPRDAPATPKREHAKRRAADRPRRPADGEHSAEQQGAPSSSARSPPQGLARGGSSAVCFTIRDTASGAPPPPSGAPPPPVLTMPPPPPPPGCGPGIALDRATSRYIEHHDPATGDKYYEDQHGHVTWDEPPAHKLVR